MMSSVSTYCTLQTSHHLARTCILYPLLIISYSDKGVCLLSGMPKQISPMQVTSFVPIFLCIVTAIALLWAFQSFSCSIHNATVSVKKPSTGETKVLCNGTDRDFLRRELRRPCQKQGYSQGNQDCQLDAIFHNIGTTNKFYVEYGFNTNQQCSGSGPNTCKLWKEQGWTGLLLDGENQNPEINLHAHYLYGNNAADTLKQHGVPSDLDFLSGDMDSHDYFVMANILEHFRPRVVTTEYNRNWPADFTITQIDPTLDPNITDLQHFKFRNCVWGASAMSLKQLMEKHSYSLIGVTPGLDLIWGQQDAVLCFDVPSFDEYLFLMNLGSLSHPPQQDLLFLNWLADTTTWEATKDINQARIAAQNKLTDHMMNSNTVIPCLRKAAQLVL